LRKYPFPNITTRGSCMPLKLWPLVAVAAIVAVAASPASAASIYHGCDAQQWGTALCWDPSNPADIAAMHPCPMWTDRHTPAFNQGTGAYVGFVKIRSTIGCKLAHKLIYDRGAGGVVGYYPAAGWLWWPGFNNVGGHWRDGPRELFRGFHIARTNERVGHSSIHPTMLEHDLITFDTEELIDCSTVPKVVHCINVTPASYAGVPL